MIIFIFINIITTTTTHIIIIIIIIIVIITTSEDGVRKHGPRAGLDAALPLFEQKMLSRSAAVVAVNSSGNSYDIYLWLFIAIYSYNSYVL